MYSVKDRLSTALCGGLVTVYKIFQDRSRVVLHLDTLILLQRDGSQGTLTPHLASLGK